MKEYFKGPGVLSYLDLTIGAGKEIPEEIEEEKKSEWRKRGYLINEKEILENAETGQTKKTAPPKEIEKAFEELTAKLETLTETIAEVRKENAELKTLCEDLRKEIAGFKEEKSEMQKELNGFKKRNNR